MDLTQRERDELDAATGQHAVHVIRRIERVDIVPVAELSTVPVQQLAQDYLWRWNDIDGMWEHYGDPGSTVPTDVYRPNFSLSERMAWEGRNNSRRALAGQGNDQGTTVGVDTGLSATEYNGNYYVVNPAQFAYTYVPPEANWEHITVRTDIATSRGNNYDIVHKATNN